MREKFTVENLLGVGSFTCTVQKPVEGFYRLTALEGEFSLTLLDTYSWFEEYDISDISEEIREWSRGKDVSVATTVNGGDGNLTNAVTNLAGPLVIDWTEGRIRQFVIHSGKYPLRVRLFKPGQVK